MKKNKVLILLLCIICLGEVALLVYQVPSVRNRVDWRLANLRAEIHDFFYPHPQMLATPNPTQMAMVLETITAEAENRATASALADPTSENTSPLLPTVTPTATFERPPTPVSTLLPFSYHEYQGYNNCGPATLTMILRYYGWEGTQTIAANYLKPDPDDKNVMPYEIENFVLQETDYGIRIRTGGRLDDLRSLIAAGFPVMIEKGLWVNEANKGWMGHYLLLTGYDETNREFVSQDSYHGPNQKVDYDALIYDWRAFNFIYLVVYPWERQPDLEAILGPDVDLATNLQDNLDLELREVQILDGQSLAYAYSNLGSIHVKRLEYVDAAYDYDMANSIGLPWRFLWYQTGEYAAYYYSGRYQDVYDLANTTLMEQKHLEESWYWRGMARMALGDRQGAIDDWRQALIMHPGFPPAVEQLRLAGELA